MDFARAGVDEIEVIHVNIGTRRTDGDRLARGFRLNRNFSVCTRKSALRSRGERQRIRLDINRAACCRYLARRSKFNSICFERCRRRTRRLDLGIRIELERAARLELHRARFVCHAVRADREIARDVDIRAARCRGKAHVFADCEIRAVLEHNLLRLAVELAEEICAREIDLRLIRFEQERVRREDARAFDGVLRAKRQCTTWRDRDCAADRQLARTRVDIEVAVCRHAVHRDIRLLLFVADNVPAELPYLAPARKGIAREVKPARPRAEVDGLALRERPDLRRVSDDAGTRDRAVQCNRIRAQLDIVRRDDCSSIEFNALATLGLADDRDLAHAHSNLRARELDARRRRRRAARHLDIAVRAAQRGCADRGAAEIDAGDACIRRVRKAYAVLGKTAAELDIAAARLALHAVCHADIAARTVVRIGEDVEMERARRRGDIGIDADVARRLQGQRRIAARRLRDGVLHLDEVIIVARQIRCLDGYRCTTVQRIGDGLHVRLRAGFRITRRSRLDLDVVGVNQPFAALARVRRSIDCACDLHLLARGLDGAARARAFAACRDLARVLRPAVRPDGDRAARGIRCRRIGTHRRAALDCDIFRMREVARALPAAADLNRAGFRAAHVRHAARRKAHVVRRHADRARLADKARGTHDTLLIDSRGNECVARRRCHEDESAVRFNDAFVRDALFHRRFRRYDRDLAVAREVERDVLRRCENRRALLGDDDAFIDDILAEKRDCTRIRRTKRAAIDDLAVIRRADEGILARHEIGVRDVHRRGENRARIDLRSMRKKDARRVDEEDAPVRRERSEDLGGIPPEHTVQQSCLSIRLIDIDALVCRDVEALPVDDGVLSRLMNRHLRLTLGDVGSARRDFTALRQGAGRAARTNEGCARRHDADAAQEGAAHVLLQAQQEGIALAALFPHAALLFHEAHGYFSFFV